MKYSDSQIRKLLLSRLDEDYSERRHDSLHNLIKIDLQIEEQIKRVGRHKSELIPEDIPQSNLLNRVFKYFPGSNEVTPLSPTQKTIEFYERDDVGRKLLILGEPGGGKTTELLSLADDLLERAKEDQKEPIPVILELSAWKVNQPFTNWLVNQIHETYGLGKSTGKRWLDSGQFIFLLDGLDELGLVNETKCIEVINQFLVDRLQPGLVVCCRREEYEQSEVKLEQLQGAIYLQQLTNEQIDQYLQGLKRSSVWQNLKQESELLELARSPLFLNMLAVAYQGNAIRNSQELFETYIKKQIQDPKCQGTYPPGKNPSPEKSLSYLVWLAKKLEGEEVTDFLIEKMQPTWLESSKEKRLYRLSFGLIYGLSFGLITVLSSGLSFGLIYELSSGLISGLIFGLIAALSPINFTEKLEFSLNRFFRFGLSGGLSFGLSLGVIIGLSGQLSLWLMFGRMGGLSLGMIGQLSLVLIGQLSLGLIMGLIYGLIYGLIMGPIYQLMESEIPAKKGVNQGFFLSFIKGMFVGLMGQLIMRLSLGLIFGLIRQLIMRQSRTFIFEVSGGQSGRLIVGLIGVLIVGLIFALMESEISAKKGVNQGIWLSFKNGVIFGLIFGVSFGLAGGLIFSLAGGLTTVMQHCILRLILYRNGYIPWDYSRFLDHAAKHRFIQRVGGRYRFMHHLLRKQFATMPLDEGELRQFLNT